MGKGVYLNNVHLVIRNLQRQGGKRAREMTQQFRVPAALSKDPDSIPSSHIGCLPTACSSSSIDLTCVSSLQYFLSLPHASQCPCLQLIASLLGNLDSKNNLHSLLVRTKSPIFRSLLRFRPSTPLQGRDFPAGSRSDWPSFLLSVLSKLPCQSHNHLFFFPSFSSHLLQKLS